MSHVRDAADLIWVSFGLAFHVGGCVFPGFLDIAADVESVARSLGDGQTVVETGTAWDCTESAVPVRGEKQWVGETYTMTRHILSTASWHSPRQVEAFAPSRSDSLKPEVTIKAMMAAVNWPIPCIANTAFIIAPLHFVVANSDVIIEDNG